MRSRRDSAVWSGWGSWRRRRVRLLRQRMVIVDPRHRLRRIRWLRRLGLNRRLIVLSLRRRILRCLLVRLRCRRGSLLRLRRLRWRPKSRLMGIGRRRLRRRLRPRGLHRRRELTVRRLRLPLVGLSLRLMRRRRLRSRRSRMLIGLMVRCVMRWLRSRESRRGTRWRLMLLLVVLLRRLRLRSQRRVGPSRLRSRRRISRRVIFLVLVGRHVAWCV